MKLPITTYDIGDIVYHRLQPEAKGMVTGILFRPGRHFYLVTWDSLDEKEAYDVELSDERCFGEEGGGTKEA